MMVYEYSFDIFAIVAYIGVLLMYIFQKNYPTRAGKAFVAILVMGLFSSVADLISAFTISYASELPVFVNYLVNMVYLFCMNMSGVFFYRYAMAVIRVNRYKKWFNLVFWILTGFIGVYIATTPWTHLVFEMTENGYEHGVGFIVLYVISYALLLFCAAAFVKYRAIIGRTQIMVMVAYILIMIISVIVQMLFPKYLISCMAMAIAAILIYASLERPADFQYRNTTCYNERAFSDTVERKLLGGEQFSVVVLAIENMAYIRKIISRDEWNKFIEYEISVLHLHFDRRSVFCFEGGLFAIVSSDPDRVIRALMDYSEMNGDFDSTKDWNYAYTPFFWKIPVPDTVTDEAEMKDAIVYIRDHVDEGAALHVYEFSKEHLNSKKEDLKTLHAIRRAVEENTFRVFYQPIFDLNTGKFVTSEALLRLTDSEMGPISPDVFIPIAEKYGCIMEIDECVLKNVSRFIADNKIENYGVESVHINLSGVRYVTAGLADYVQNMLGQFAVSPSMIDLEITERAEFSDDSAVIHNMTLLCEKGVSFALDDFGTGYSNMTHLMRFPIRTVKIDKSLLWQAVKDEKAMTMLEAFMGMIREAGKKCVVEGVETEEMVELLRKLGCDYLQGFYYSRPLPEEEYLMFLKTHNKES